ncbi:MAG: hypothetical protein K2X64_12160 [Rhodocyclaceae bacterium]|nr:hypothetical protein [Rhodocyclaceae bacterium]
MNNATCAGCWTVRECLRIAAACPNLTNATDPRDAKIAELMVLVERLKLEAQSHAQEARSANATIAEIYQLCTGSTGEPGNWNGAEPVRKVLADLRAQLEAVGASGVSGRLIGAAGWKLVPIEPTDDMEVAAENDYENRGETFPNWKNKWRVMLSAAPLPPTAQPAEPHPDDKAVDSFAESMKRKLAQKRNEGKSGWQDRSWTPEQISQALCDHVVKGDPTDVANYCMFLAERGESIVALPTHKSLVMPDADMFWNDSDRERQHHSIEEFLNEEMCAGFDVQVGAEFTLLCASSLPNVRIRVTAVDEEACEAQYEVIDAAINTGGTT